MSVLPKAYALLIGVGKDLPVTVRDANAIRNILADKEFAGYSPENIILLTEENSTRKDIIDGFDSIIKKADQESSVLIFYSGHGGTYLDNDILHEHEQKPDHLNERHFYLQPNDFDADNFDETWVTADEVKEKIRQINSKRLVFLLDCCHAEGMTKAVDFIIPSETNHKLRQPEQLAQKIDDGRGISIISSCRADQQSYILEGDVNSLFTKSLIEVLKGKHKTEFSESFIRITEVAQYLFKRIPEQIDNQKPYVNLQIYDDFILSKVPAKLLTTQATETKENIKQEEPTEIKTVFRENKQANNVLLFVHGFTGEAHETFGQTPELIMNDERFAGWDLFPIGYTQNIRPNIGKQVWASKTETEMMADYLEVIINSKFKLYDRIAIIAHGMGGIVTQLAINKMDSKLVTKLSHVFLFCSPNNGLPTETILNIGGESVNYLGENEPFITDMRTKWSEKFKNDYPFRFRAIAATDDEYIPIDSNLKPFREEKEVIIRGNHFSVVKPGSIDDEAYKVIVENLLGNEFFHAYTTPEEINITLGKFQKVVDTLLPQKDSLDAKGIQSLCFALEGLDQDEEVRIILEEFINKNEDTDIISLLAGRYKREYLKKFQSKSAELALSLYEKALLHSQNQKDDRKIYYNAINLAFLHVVAKNDHSQMMFYNDIVKRSLINDPFPSLWKTATEAESAMYNADFETAKEKYTIAAEMADIRQKISIYTNAYTAYSKLMNTTSTEDNFIQFLQQKFL